jgi:hypothetical protein
MYVVHEAMIENGDVVFVMMAGGGGENAPRCITPYM